MKTRVIQWATGTTGMMAMRQVVQSGNLELVGIRVYDPDKVGRDAGELCGIDPIGVLTTDDRDHIINTDADVVLYMGKVETDLPGCFADVRDLLASGKNVIATGSRFIHPASLHQSLADGIEEACAKGGTSFLGLGLFPGFVGETLAPVLSRLSQRAARIEVREVLSYAGYASTDLMFDTMGFGRLPDDPTPLLADNERAALAWIGTVTILAQSLGLEILSTQGFRYVATTDRPLDVAAGHIASGTVGAMRFGLEANCGDVTLFVEHITRMADDLAPEWPTKEGYEIVYEGEPSITCHLLVAGEGTNHAEEGCRATAMHAVNAIPAIVAAKPGLLDLSLVAPFVGLQSAGSS